MGVRQVNQIARTLIHLLCSFSLVACVVGANVRFAIIGDFGVDDVNEQEVANLVATSAARRGEDTVPYHTGCSWVFRFP